MKKKERIVNTKIRGGLGNQMFQYAIARNAQLENELEKIRIVYDHHLFNNKLEIFKLNNITESITLDDFKSEKSKIRHYIETAIKKIPKLTKIYYKKEGIYIYEDGPVIKIPNNDKYYFVGYWQSDKYFKQHEKEIREDFKFKLKMRQKIVDYGIKMKSEESVCVHIRLGDYLRGKALNKFYICKEEYYQRALKIMKEKLNNPTFYIFSNDIKMAENMLTKDKDNIIFVSEESDVEELYLMTNCNHFIISNSTFSWWAQFLCENDKKIVCAPDVWLNGKDWNQIYQDNWLIVPTK